MNELAPPSAYEIGTSRLSDPASLYIARLGPGSRRAQAQALRGIVDILAPGLGLTPREYPWHRLSPAQATALQARVTQDLAPATARRWMSALKGVLQEAWRLGLIDREGMARIRTQSPVRGRRRETGRGMTPPEVKSLLGHARGQKRALIRALIWGGLRRSEAAALKPEHITYVSPDQARLEVLGKGSKWRAVYLAGEAARDILDAAQACPPGAPLFGLSTGGAIWAWLRRLARKAGVDNLTPHDLRRTFISCSLDAGVDLATVQQAAGHADPRTTSSYDRRGDGARRRAADSLAAALDSPVGPC